MLLASNFRSMPAHSCILRGNAATKAALTKLWGGLVPPLPVPSPVLGAPLAVDRPRVGSALAGAGARAWSARPVPVPVPVPPVPVPGSIGGGWRWFDRRRPRGRCPWRRRRIGRRRPFRRRQEASSSVRAAVASTGACVAVAAAPGTTAVPALHDNGRDLGGLRRRGSWESGRRRRRGGSGRGGCRFNRGRGGVAEQGDAEHRRGDGRGDRRQTEQHKRAAPRRLLVLPVLVAEVHLGARVGRRRCRAGRPRCRRLGTRPAPSTAQRPRSSPWRRQQRERSASAWWPCRRPGCGARSAPRPRPR